jgi:hypothetical protein
MAAHVLVVATVTATSDDLMEALQERVRRSSVPVDFTLVMPASGPDLSEMQPRLDEALERWREAGLKVEGTIGDADPVVAVSELWNPGAFDEVIVSTLPGQTSRWLRSDVPYRIGRMCDLPVTHVVAMSMAKPEVHGEPPPRRKRDVVGILNVMAYRGSHPRENG